MAEITIIKDAKTLVIQTVTLAPPTNRRQSARVGTLANITLSGLQTIDGVALVAGDRVLVKNQTLGQQNGVYTVAAGVWSRAADSDVPAELHPGCLTAIEEGTQAETVWILATNGPIVIGTTVLVFQQFGVSSGQNLGAGAQVYKQNSGSVLQFRSLLAGYGVEIVQNADDIQIRTNQFDWKESVRAATIGNIALSGLLTIDDVALLAGDRVLVKDQTLPEQNGIYVVAAGAWSRSADADVDQEVTPGLVVGVEEGTANEETAWILATNAPIVLGTTELTFAQFGGGGNTGTLLTATTLTYPIDYNLVGAALVPPGTIFTEQGDIDAYLLANSTTAFKYVMDCWDATPRILAHNVTFTLAAGIHRARPTDPLTAVFNLVGKFSVGGVFTLQGALSSTWDPVAGPFTVASVTSAPDPSITFSGTPFTGMNLRGLHVVLSTGQVGVIHDHNNSTLFVTANLSPSPVGGTGTIARPSTILRNSDNDIVHRTTSPTLRLGIGGSGGTHVCQDLRIDTFSGSSAAWAVLLVDRGMSVFLSRVLNDYDIQLSAFGRVPDGRTVQLNGVDQVISTSLVAVKAPSTSGEINDFIFANNPGNQAFLSDTVAYNPRSTNHPSISMISAQGGQVQLNKTVLDWLVNTSLGNGIVDIGNGVLASFFDGFGLGTFSALRSGARGLVLRSGSLVRDDRNDTAIKFRNITGAAAVLFDGAACNLSLADGAHGFKDDGGNTGVGFDVIGPHARLKLSSGTTVAGTLGAVRMSTGAIETYPDILADGPVTDTAFNYVQKVS